MFHQFVFFYNKVQRENSGKTESLTDLGIVVTLATIIFRICLEHELSALFITDNEPLSFFPGL